MKKILTTSLILFSLLLGSQQLMSQPPEPPSGHGDTGNQNAGNAPIGGGLFILLGLGAAYGAKKVYTLYYEQKETLEE